MSGEFGAYALTTRQRPRASDLKRQTPDEPPGNSHSGNPFELNVERWRLILIAALVISGVLIWLNTSGNQIPPRFIVLWFVTSLLWGIVFAPADWNVLDWFSEKIDRWRRVRWRDHRWTIVAFVLILMLGASFRFTELRSIPPEMTSDHVEKIQDAYRVHSGDYKIFFPNNGGREPVQMYLVGRAVQPAGPGFRFLFAQGAVHPRKLADTARRCSGWEWNCWAASASISIWRRRCC